MPPPQTLKLSRQLTGGKCELKKNASGITRARVAIGSPGRGPTSRPPTPGVTCRRSPAARCVAGQAAPRAWLACAWPVLALCCTTPLVRHWAAGMIDKAGAWLVLALHGSGSGRGLALVDAYSEELPTHLSLSPLSHYTCAAIMLAAGWQWGQAARR